MEKQIRVLMLMANLRVSNGVVSYAMNYFRKINHNNIKIDFCLLDDVPTPYYDEIRSYGRKIYILPTPKRIGAHVKKCHEILRDGNYDVIHDNSLLLTYPMMRIAKRYVPVRILHSHNSRLGETAKKERRNKHFLPFLLHQANAYAACSDLAAKAMFGNSNYEFIPNFIDADGYEYNREMRDRIRSEMNVGDKRIIATVGRVAPQKNPFFALDIIDLVADHVPEVEYWWIGSGPLDQKVAEYAKKLKHSNQIRLLGSRNDMRELYQAIDLFFLPSVFEGLPVTGVEAQAMGLRCVVSDTITKEMVYTDLVEFISLNEEKEIWAESIIAKLKEKNERRSYRQELLSSKFSDAHAAGLLEQYYRNLLDR